MEKALKIINEMLKNEVIRDYAIGGGIAALFYIEPILTYNLDIFFIPKEERIDILSDLYKYLKEKGYDSEKEYILIEGITVQFIPVYNNLVIESVEKSIESCYLNTATKVLRPEYLIAISLQTFRPKDIDRIMKFLKESEVDFELLESILKSHELLDKYLEFKEKYYEK